MDCEAVCKKLADSIAHMLPLQERKTIAKHLLKCEECLAKYAEEDEVAEANDETLYTVERAFEGPLTVGLDEEGGYERKILSQAQRFSKKGGIIVVRHDPIQEKSVLLMFCALSVKLKRKGGKVIFVSPYNGNLGTLLEPHISKIGGSGMWYLLAPEGAGALDAQLFLEDLVSRNKKLSAKMVAIIGDSSPNGLTLLSKKAAVCQLSSDKKESARFAQRMEESLVDVEEKLAGMPTEIQDAYRTVSLLDSLRISVSTTTLADALSMSKEEVVQLVGMSKGFLFWVRAPKEDSKLFVSTSSPSLAAAYVRKAFPEETALANTYAELVKVSLRNNQRGAALVLVHMLVQNLPNIATRVMILCRAPLEKLWQSGTLGEIENRLWSGIFAAIGDTKTAVEFRDKARELANARVGAFSEWFWQILDPLLDLRVWMAADGIILTDEEVAAWEKREEEGLEEYLPAYRTGAMKVNDMVRVAIEGFFLGRFEWVKMVTIARGKDRDDSKVWNFYRQALLGRIQLELGEGDIADEKKGN